MNRTALLQVLVLAAMVACVRGDVLTTRESGAIYGTVVGVDSIHILLRNEQGDTVIVPLDELEGITTSDAMRADSLANKLRGIRARFTAARSDSTALPTQAWTGPSALAYLAGLARMEEAQRLNAPKRKAVVCCAVGAGALEIAGGIATPFVLGPGDQSGGEATRMLTGCLIGAGVVTAGIGILGGAGYFTRFKGEAEKAYAKISVLSAGSPSASFDRELTAARSLKRMSDGHRRGRYPGCAIGAALGLSMVIGGLGNSSKSGWGYVLAGSGALGVVGALVSLGERSSYELTYQEYLKKGGQVR